MTAPDGEHYGRVWYLHDITDRTRFEAALLESEGRYRAVVEHSADGIAIATGTTYVFANRAAALLLGLQEPSQVVGRTIEVITDLWSVPRVLGEEAELRELLTNLVFNAVDAIPGRGTITLRTRGAGERVRLEVTDTGIGMTEDARRRCFEPFFSTKGAQGTGLGLAVVHGIVQRHHGEIVVTGVPGEGTTVTVYLPVVAPHASRLAGADAPAPAMASLHVLHVDDEPGVGEVVAAYLCADGHTVETTTTGRDALDRLRTEHFDVVITDSAMPGIGGRQLAVLGKALSPATPVVLPTGFGDLMAATGELPPGVDRIMGKPVTLATLRTALAVVVQEGSTP